MADAIKFLNDLNETVRFDYTGTVIAVRLFPGIYNFECHGAQGNGPYGGYGGVMAGQYKAKEEIILFLYIGGQGSGRFGGWNGGGTGAVNWGGGGGTDIALFEGTWNSREHLYSRILVAGGGGGCCTGGYSGGAGHQWYGNHWGGKGGGEYGGNGAGSHPGYGAGPNYAGWSSWVYGSQAGGFGYGANAGNHYGELLGCGGGGWYGGSSAKGDGDNGGGGGGSGYCFCKKTKQYYPSGCLLNDSFLLTEIDTIEPNNTGNGYILITKIQDVGIRKNTNIYKDIALQEIFEYNKLFD